MDTHPLYWLVFQLAEELEVGAGEKWKEGLLQLLKSSSSRRVGAR